MQDLSLTLSALQDPYYDIPSEDVSDEEESDPGSFSEGELRQMRGDDLIVLDGSEGDDLPKTAESLEGLYTGSYQELSERCRLSRLHCCTGSSHCSLTLLKIEGQTPGSFLSNSPPAQAAYCSCLMPSQPAHNAVACCCCTALKSSSTPH